MFKKKVSIQVHFNFHRSMDDRVPNTNPKKVKGTSSPIKKQTCGKYGKKNYGDCLKRTDNYFGCGKSGHTIKDLM